VDVRTAESAAVDSSVVDVDVSPRLRLVGVARGLCMGLVPKPVTCVQRSVAATTTTTTSTTILRNGAGDLSEVKDRSAGDLASDFADSLLTRTPPTIPGIIVLAGWKELEDYI